MLPLGVVEFDQACRRPASRRDEQITLMTLWSIARSPLIHGGDMTRTDAFTLSLLTNDEVIAVNQHSANNRQLFRTDDGLIAWVADAVDGGAKYLAVFDTRDATDGAAGTRPIPVELAALGLQGQVQVRDLWSRAQLKPVSGTVKPQVAPHGARLFRLTPSADSSTSKP